MSIMIIQRKKHEVVILLVVFIFQFLLFTSLAIYIFMNFNDETSMENLKLLVVVAVLPSAIILVYNFNWLWRKLLSNNPEFEISDEMITVYDNPKFETIMLDEIEHLEILKTKMTLYMLLALSPSTHLNSNYKITKRELARFPGKNYCWIALDITFAKIRPYDFLELLKGKIELVKKA